MHSFRTTPNLRTHHYFAAIAQSMSSCSRIHSFIPFRLYFTPATWYIILIVWMPVEMFDSPHTNSISISSCYIISFPLRLFCTSSISSFVSLLRAILRTIPWFSLRSLLPEMPDPAWTHIIFIFSPFPVLSFLQSLCFVSFLGALFLLTAYVRARRASDFHLCALVFPTSSQLPRRLRCVPISLSAHHFLLNTSFEDSFRFSAHQNDEPLLSCRGVRFTSTFTFRSHSLIDL